MEPPVPEYHSPFPEEVREKILEIGQLMQDIIVPRCQQLLSLPSRTEEEEQEIVSYFATLQQVMPVLDMFQEKVGHEMVAYYQSLFLYAKKKAENGDEEARKFYEHLKPSYEDMMKGDTDDRAN